MAFELLKKKADLDFLGGPVSKMSPSNAGGVGLIPSRWAKIPHP